MRCQTKCMIISRIHDYGGRRYDAPKCVSLDRLDRLDRDKNDGDMRKQRLQVMGVFSSSPDCIISVVLHLLTLVRTPETAAFNRESIVMLDSRRPNKPLLPHPKETQLSLARLQLRLRLGN